VSKACAEAGVDRSTAYEARQRDEDFALAWAAAEERVTAQLEEELHRLASGDVPDPKRAHVQLRAIEVAVRARAPERYGRTQVEHSGSLRLRHTDVATLSDEDLERLAGGGCPRAAAQREIARRELLRRRHREDPAGWITDRLGAHLWSAQRRIAAAVAEHRYVAVRSAHGIGKDWLAARLAAWWLGVHRSATRSR